ncbi:diguanylate cyclase [Achromobacter sp. F4_2707]|uniref:diguanylate cyclase domain-containing protein n=1 Tax=Achromobacter sp. F4_2707 TaxID=3114286 RepID=UPI0039C5D501
MPSRWLKSRLLQFSAVIALGIGVLVFIQLLESRSSTWQRAQTANTNLLFTVGHALESTFETADRSLRHSVVVMEAAAGHGRTGMNAALTVPPDTLLFAAVPENGFGHQLVLDNQGNVLAASGSPPPGDWGFGGRPYFTAHRDHADAGFFIGAPFLSAMDNRPSVPMSRRWNLPDGSFGGVIVQTLKLSVLYELFSSFELGADSGINVFSSNGSVLVRFPYTGEYLGVSLKGTPNFERFAREKQGSFTGIAAIDEIERLYVFRTLNRYPIIINVAQSSQTILGNWQRNALWLGSATLALMAACVFLAIFAEQHLRAHRRTSQRLGQAERELRTIVDSLPALVAYWDKQLVNRMANIAHQQWLGLAPGDMVGRHVSEVTKTDKLFAQPYLDAALAGEPQVFEHDLVDADGALRHTLTTLIPDKEDGEVKGLFLLVTDISARKATEMALFEEKERFRVILESIKDGVITTNHEGRVRYLNPAAEAMTGWSLEEAREKRMEEVMQVESATGEGIGQCPLQEVLSSRRASRNKIELVLVSRAGERMHIENSAAPILNEQGQVLGAVVVFHDSGPVRAMANKMIHLAQHDALTSLPNRRRLDLVGRQALLRAGAAGHKVAVLYLDLDGFKQVNDEHGHAVGDQLLVAITNRLSARLRSNDSLYRQGGDEFVVLMKRIESYEEVERLAMRLIESCQTPVGVADQRFSITVSIGIGIYPDDALKLGDLIQHADRGMYVAKGTGRNRYAWLSETADTGDAAD